MYFSYIQEHCSTALIVASENGQSEVAAVLIARGAIVDYQNKVRQSCLIQIITVVLKNGIYDHRNMSAWETP